MKYKFTATVERNVSDVIDIHIQAKDEGEAYAKARRILSVYPEEHFEDGCDYCYVDQRSMGFPEVLTIEEKKNVA